MALLAWKICNAFTSDVNISKAQPSKASGLGGVASQRSKSAPILYKYRLSKKHHSIINISKNEANVSFLTTHHPESAFSQFLQDSELVTRKLCHWPHSVDWQLCHGGESLAVHERVVQVVDGGGCSSCGGRAGRGRHRGGGHRPGTLAGGGGPGAALPGQGVLQCLVLVVVVDAVVDVGGAESVVVGGWRHLVVRCGRLEAASHRKRRGARL